MFRDSVKSTGYPLHSPVSPSLPLPCVTVCHLISTGVYSFLLAERVLMDNSPISTGVYSFLLVERVLMDNSLISTVVYSFLLVERVLMDHSPISTGVYSFLLVERALKDNSLICFIDFFRLTKGI